MTASRRYALAIFAATPGLTPAKPGLVADLGATRAEEFHRLSLIATQAVVNDVIEKSPFSVTPIWVLAEAEGPRDAYWKNRETLWTGDGTLGQRLHRIYGSLQARYDCVALIGTDTPLLSAKHILEAYGALSQSCLFSIGPNHAGGFYLFAGNKAVPDSVWAGVPYGAETALADLMRLLLPIGAMNAVEVLHDIDGMEDICATAMTDDAGLLPEQQALLAWMRTI